MNLYPIEHKCPQCGKVFLSREPWGYVRSDKKICSYHCLREYDKRSRLGKSTKRLGERERKEIIAMLAEGMSPQKVSDLMGVTLQAVLYYRGKIAY